MISSGYDSRIDSYIPLKVLASIVSDRLIHSGSIDQGNAGWPTRKYSIDHETEINLMVNNAAILYPLLRAYNMGVIKNKNSCKKLIQIAKLVYNQYEQDFDSSIGTDGGYRFRKGINFQWDGIALPFNQQNLFGLALIELYKTTGNSQYRNRAFQLARTF